MAWDRAVPTVRGMTRTPTALITGASRGLGLALARSLAADGWQLVVDGRDPTALHDATHELGELSTVWALPGDVADEAHRRALAETAGDIGGLDAVVHNASTLGVSPLVPLARHPSDALRRVFEVNVLAPVTLTGLLLPHLRAGARIVAVTSDAAVEAYAGWGAYGASKAALEQAFAVLAVEHPELRIYRVDPGEMRTQMYQESAPGEDISHLPPPEVSVPGIRALLFGDLPSGRYLARDLAPVPTAATTTTNGSASR
jgi:NAD(P)-dependent dehydrogenase (short-subunit alcohol dehydrogenase family)